MEILKIVCHIEIEDFSCPNAKFWDVGFREKFQKPWLL